MCGPGSWLTDSVGHTEEKGSTHPKQKLPLLEVSHINIAMTWSESCPKK